MLARAATKLAGRIAAGFLVALALLGYCTYRVVIAEQHTQAEQQLNYALAYGSPNDATPCLWLFVVENGKVLHPQQAPAGFPLESAIAASRTSATPTPVQTTVSLNGTQYDVISEDQDGIVRQAVFDAWYQLDDIDHLFRALLMVGLLGVGAATIVGAELGRRSIAPLGDALARQRRFVADASHELRTPLTRLHTRTQLLLRWKQDQQLPARFTEELDALVRSAGELNDVVEDLLISAALRTDPHRRRDVDLSALVTEVMEAERPRLESRTLVLDGAPATVHGAESPLRRMITALIDNAVGHTEPTGRIEVAVRQTERNVIELEVTDDGTGFDPADRQRIFERFAQSGRPGPHRFGLGLALAREIAADHGGTIRAVGRPGHGATFTVRLPAAPNPAARRMTRRLIPIVLIRR